ncbi:hypothetical protein TNIN_450921 [Trichonephila inaurata madagascariensis]|uniref:Uncharacterized protein n=1 Tax=Trichonephila inaurata madagascariensis TaxID=2747483 RepID=A0A8X7BXZ2_9ARAC|nr:hypothetical protein TNIN_450921 [Trichonephila inaurata madagascariensis]
MSFCPIASSSWKRSLSLSSGSQGRREDLAFSSIGHCLTASKIIISNPVNRDTQVKLKMRNTHIYLAQRKGAISNDRILFADDLIGLAQLDVYGDGKLFVLRFNLFICLLASVSVCLKIYTRLFWVL